MEQARSSSPLMTHGMYRDTACPWRGQPCCVCAEMLQGACHIGTLPPSTPGPQKEAQGSSNCWAEAGNKRYGEVGWPQARTGCGEPPQGRRKAMGIRAADEPDCLRAQPPSPQYVLLALLTSITTCKFKNKMITNFKIVTREH